MHRRRSYTKDVFDPGLGRPHHSGYVVESIEVTVKRLVEQFGAGPFLVVENVPLEAQAAAEEVRNRFEERGLESYLSSRLNGEYTTVHDASATLGHDIEILVDAPAFRGFFGMVLDAAEGWDGSDPLRPLG